MLIFNIVPLIMEFTFGGDLSQKASPTPSQKPPMMANSLEEKGECHGQADHVKK
jgi:hypothetical protein